MFNESTNYNAKVDPEKGLIDTFESRGEGDGSTNKLEKTKILQSIPGRVNAISSRPNKSEIAISCDSGSTIFKWSYESKEYILSKLPPFNSLTVQDAPVEKLTTL